MRQVRSWLRGGTAPAATESLVCTHPLVVMTRAGACVYIYMSFETLRVPGAAREPATGPCAQGFDHAHAQTSDVVHLELQIPALVVINFPTRAEEVVSSTPARCCGPAWRGSGPRWAQLRLLRVSPGRPRR